MFQSIKRNVSRAALPPLAALAIACCLTPATGAFANETISVVVDQATIVRMPERVTKLVIGNPMIADVSLQAGGTMVVTGKGYGSTNLIAMDRAGTILSERDIQVQGGGERIVTVYRGVERESYSCTPQCQRRITLGDTTTYFKANIEQTDSLNSQASGLAAASAANGPSPK